VSDDLTVLRDEFPAYWIWREETPGRSRYIARSKHQGLNPHTVVTPYLRELRDALQPGQNPQAAGREPDGDTARLAVQAPALRTQPGAAMGTSGSR
jgi:hypothetical protein